MLDELKLQLWRERIELLPSVLWEMGQLWSRSFPIWLFPLLPRALQKGATFLGYTLFESSSWRDMKWAPSLVALCPKLGSVLMLLCIRCPLKCLCSARSTFDKMAKALPAPILSLATFVSYPKPSKVLSTADPRGTVDFRWKRSGDSKSSDNRTAEGEVSRNAATTPSAMSSYPASGLSSAVGGSSHF